MNSDKLGTLVKWNDNLHIYEIVGYNHELVDDFILKNTSRETLTLDVQTGSFVTTYEPITEITDDKTNKYVWKLRTNINKKKKEIETKRKQAVAIMISDFVEFCRGIEEELENASNQLTRLLNNHKEQQSKETETAVSKKFTITITTTNADLVEQIKNLATDNNAEISVKEK